MIFNFTSFFKKQDDRFLNFIKHQARKEFLISFFIDFSVIASVNIFLISIISFVTTYSFNDLAKVFFPIFVISMILIIFKKKNKI